MALLALPFAYNTPNIVPAANEVQTVTVNGTPTGGTFQLAFQGEQTGALAYNVAAEDLEDALEALTGVGVGNVTVSGTAPYIVTFAGAMAARPWPLITLVRIALTGGTAPTVTIGRTTAGSSGSVVLYTPTIGQHVTLTGVSVLTAWDGTTPAAVLATQDDADPILASPVDLTVADGGSDDLSTWSVAGSVAKAGDFLTASPVIISVSDGAGGDPGASHGSAVVYLRVD